MFLDFVIKIKVIKRIKMLKEENQVVSITNVSESVNKRRVTHAQTNASVPLGITQVKTKVSNNHIVYIGDHVELIKNPESTPIKLTKSAKKRKKYSKRRRPKS